MQELYSGIFIAGGKLYTANLIPGQQVYNESLVPIANTEYRSWNPYKSKLAAAIKNGLQGCPIKRDSNILYLGAATGTTVSHISDIATDGIIYAVEISAGAMRKLLLVARQRHNIVPILGDAKKPRQFETSVSAVDVLYQDIAQRDQIDIFCTNMTTFHAVHGIIMVKARSIDVSRKPGSIFADVKTRLQQYFTVMESVSLEPFSLDHQAIMVHNPE
jgi:fibrillarin-like pre-rRNA processing protein